MALSKAMNPQCRALFVGLATVDAEYFLDDLPGPNQKITAQSQHIAAGGPATNAAVTFAFLGGHATLVTAAGRHPLADVIRHDSEQFGIELSDIASEHDEAPPLSSIFILRKSGERTVISANAGAFASLRYDANQQWMEKASIVLVDGHYMPLCQAVASLARSRGIRVVLDAGSWKPGMAELLSKVDIAICSDDFWPPGCKTESEVFSYLSKQGIRSMAITRGKRPICYMENEVSDEVTVPDIQAIDTLGAGDIFHGAFCYWACQSEHSFRDCLQFAAHVASFSCRYLGTRLWMDAFPGIEAIQHDSADV